MEKKTLYNAQSIAAFLTLSIILFIAMLYTGSVVSYCIGFILLAAVYGLYAVSLKECGCMELLSRVPQKKLILFFVITVFYTACIFGILIRENYVYYWDYGAYWYMSLGAQDILFSDPVEALKSLYVSMNTQEYNLFLALLAAIPLKLLGNSYLAFVMLVAGIFLIPALSLLSVFIWEINKKYSIKGISFIQIYLVVLSITVPLFPVLSGYVDAAALLPLILCYLLTLKTEYAGRVEWAKSFLIGLLLVTVLLMRRYFGYAVVGYVLFLFGYAVFGNGVRNWKSGIKNKLINIAVTGLTAAAILLLFFKGFVKQSLFNNYIEAYSAYNVYGFADKWKTFCLYYGMVVIFLTFCAVLCAWKNRIINFTAPMILSFAAAMLLFYHMSDLGEHHYYITAIPVITLAVLGYEMLRGLAVKNMYRGGYAPPCLECF